MPILVLTGAAGAGKNFVASALAELLPDTPMRELSFAQTLKVGSVHLHMSPFSTMQQALAANGIR